MQTFPKTILIWLKRFAEFPYPVLDRDHRIKVFFAGAVVFAAAAALAQIYSIFVAMLPRHYSALPE